MINVAVIGQQTAGMRRLEWAGGRAGGEKGRQQGYQRGERGGRGARRGEGRGKETVDGWKDHEAGGSACSSGVLASGKHDSPP